MLRVTGFELEVESDLRPTGMDSNAESPAHPKHRSHREADWPRTGVRSALGSSLSSTTPIKHVALARERVSIRPNLAGFVRISSVRNRAAG
jgi:hypothetical protein